MPESKFIDVGDISVHYLEAGDGPPLILLHGGLATAEMSWNEVMPDLAKSYRVLAPDTRGHGRTSNPARRLSYAQMADDVAGFISMLGLERPLIYGYSDGGQAALEFSLRHPGKARALVFGGTIAAADRAYLEGLRGWGFTGPGEVDFDKMKEAFGPFFDAITTSHADWRNFVLQVSELWVTGVPDYTDAQLQSIADPVLVITGDRDDLGATRDAPRFLRQIPRAELSVIPNLDHMAINSPLFWDAVKDFLGRHAPSDSKIT